MAWPQPPPMPAVGPLHLRTTPEAVMAIVAIVIVAIVGVVAFAGTFISGSTGMFFIWPFFLFMCVPLLIIIVFVIIAIASRAGRRTIPPPPPIQQPMVPAGQQGPVALDCPNCGGPPSNVDRFGIAVCAYCGTRFLVR